MQAKAAVKSAETLPEAWARILDNPKLTAPDRRKLTDIKSSMDAGLIGRDPRESVNKRGAPKAFSKAEALRLYPAVADILREKKMAELVETTPENYRLITSEAELDGLAALLTQEPIVALDTETTGLDVYVDVIVGISITLPIADLHVYIPIKPTEDARALPMEVVIDRLGAFVESADTEKVLHNVIFDFQMFRRHGLRLRGIAWDTQTAMHILNENERERHLGGCGSFRLKDLAPKYLGVESDTFDQLFGKDARFDTIPLDVALVYAAKDTHLTWELYAFQERHLAKFPEMYRYYKTVEVPLLTVIADLETNGYVLDLEFAEVYGRELKERSNALEAHLFDVLSRHHKKDEPLNLNAPAQVRDAISAEIGKQLPGMDAKKILKPMRKTYDIIDKYLDWKTIAKLSGTYIDVLPTKQNSATKRWHSRFDPMGTVTGRFSSGKDKEAAEQTGQQFNVQNQPKEARKMFHAPKGKVLVGADFSAQEIRCVAYLSGEQVLIDAFKNNKDPYAWVASMYYGKLYDDVYKTADGSDTPERKQFKTVVLAYIYGTSKFGLADQLGITPDEAGKLMEDLSKELPRLAEWVKETQEFAKKNGFVWIGNKSRKRRLPDAKKKRKYIPKGKYNDPAHEKDRIHNSSIGRAGRQGPNARVQGESAIQGKVTMIEADAMCKEKGPEWSLWGIIHDELIFEAPDTITREDLKDIVRVMTESYVFGSVGNKTDIEIMSVWGDGIPADKWFKNREGA